MPDSTPPPPPEINPAETLRELTRALARRDWNTSHSLARLLRAYLRQNPDATLLGLSGRGLKLALSCVLVGVDLFTAD